MKGRNKKQIHELLCRNFLSYATGTKEKVMEINFMVGEYGLTGYVRCFVGVDLLSRYGEDVLSESKFDILNKLMVES